jgi:hypothetical protein
MSTAISGIIAASAFRAKDLPGLFPPGHQLVFNEQLYNGTQYILTLKRGGDLLVQSILSQLVKFYPSYTPHEALLATIYSQPIEQMRARYYAEQEEHGHCDLMFTVHKYLSRCRRRLAPFGIDIRVKHRLGYELLPLDYLYEV